MLIAVILLSIVTFVLIVILIQLKVGSASTVKGGGMYVASGSTVSISNSTFSTNKALNGGGLYIARSVCHIVFYIYGFTCFKFGCFEFHFV